MKDKIKIPALGIFIFVKLFYVFQDFSKSGRVILSKVGQDFPVEQHVFLLECPDQFRVRHAIFSAASIYLDIPELSVMGLLVLPVGEGIISGMKQCLLCLALLSRTSVAHTLGLLEDAPSSF
jgi:hypothetical protein